MMQEEIHSVWEILRRHGHAVTDGIREIVCPLHRTEHPKQKPFSITQDGKLWKCHSPKCGRGGNALQLESELSHRTTGEVWRDWNGGGLVEQEKKERRSFKAMPGDRNHYYNNGTLLHVKRSTGSFPWAHFADGEWWSGQGPHKFPLYVTPGRNGGIPVTAPLFLTEGEKDCDSLTAWGLDVFSIQKDQQWPETWLKHVEGRRVVIVRDMDEPGEKQAKICHREAMRSASAVSILELPISGEEGDKDVTEWIEKGHSLKEFHQLFKDLKWERPYITVEYLDSLDIANEWKRIGLVGNGFIQRKAATVLAAPYGKGKSTMLFQFGLHWAMGETTLAMRPTRPLKQIWFQFENTEIDMARIIQSILARWGRRGDRDIYDRLNRNFIGYYLSHGKDIFGMVEKRVNEHKPDLIWIDPLNSMLSGKNINSMEVVGRYLRTDLNKILHDFNIGCVLIHHTKKPDFKTAEEIRKNPEMISDMFLGSSDIPNYARSMMTLWPYEEPIYRLRGSKNGAWLGWSDEYGNQIIEKFIRQSEDDIFWEETSQDVAEEHKEMVDSDRIDRNSDAKKRKTKAKTDITLDRIMYTNERENPKSIRQLAEILAKETGNNYETIRSLLRTTFRSNIRKQSDRLEVRENLGE